MIFSAFLLFTFFAQKKTKSLSFEAQFNKEKMNEFVKIVRNSAARSFTGEKFIFEKTDRTQNFGIAIRFRNKTTDRGCLALYTGIPVKNFKEAIQFCTQEALNDPRYPKITEQEFENLIINISIFEKWNSALSALDFTPGSDSLILEEANGNRTLLQASLAIEHSYSKEEFLQRLSLKAGLGADGWKNNSLKFYKAKTISYTAEPAGFKH